MNTFFTLGGKTDFEKTAFLARHAKVAESQIQEGSALANLARGSSKIERFGVREGSLRSTASRRMEALLRIYNPLAVVARDRTYCSGAASRRFATIMSAIRAETRRHSVTFKILSARQVERHFALRGYATKHEIAAGLARRFEELSWKLPARRKPYGSEAHAMVIFDAAANGAAFFGRAVRQERRIDSAV